MRLKALLLSLAVTLAMTAAVHADLNGNLPAIKLDASTLPLGDVLEWRNDVSAGNGLAWKRFVAVGQPPTCEVVNGVQAVTFNGTQGFISDVENGKPWSMPADFTENGAYTVVYKVLNPGINGTERVFGWTHCGVSNRQAALFGYGNNDSYGAVNHWGTSNDMAFDRGVPPMGIWHVIAVTYSGLTATERVFVDGELSAYERKGDGWDNTIIDGHPVYIGATDDPAGPNQHFSGSLAKLMVFMGEANGPEMRQLCELPPVEDLPVLPQLVNNSFELVQGDIWVLPMGSTSNNKIESRTIPGWAWAPADDFVTGSVRRGGIAVNTKNLTSDVIPGNGWFDNGKNLDGMRVLALWDASNPKSVRQYAYFQAGRTYHIKATVNACSTGEAQLHIKAAGSDVINELVTPVDPAGYFNTDFWQFDGNFSVPDDGVWPIDIINEMTGPENVLLVDNIELYDSFAANACGVPDTVDFGAAAIGGKITTVTLNIQNMSGSNLDLMYYQRSSAANSNWAGWMDIVDAVKPGTSGSTPNITIFPYEKGQLTLKFTPPKTNTAGYSATNPVYTGELWLRWRAGSFYDYKQINWKATVPTPSTGPIVLNGSFEAKNTGPNELSPNGWYNVYGMGTIPNWLDQAQHGIGVGNRDTGQFVNNGTVNDGKQALWIQSLGADNFYPTSRRNVSQMVAGMFPGKKYRITYWANARNQGLSRANWQLRINGVVNKPNSPYGSGVSIVSSLGITTSGGSMNIADVNRVGTQGGQWGRVEHSYTATTTESVKLEFSMIQEAGESCLNIDDIRIFEEGKPAASTVYSTYGVNILPATGWNFGMGTKGMAASTNFQRTFRVFNMGGSVLNLSAIGVYGPKARNYKLTTAASTAVNPYGAYHDITVQFTPKDAGSLGEAWLQFMTDDTTGTTAKAAGKTYAYSFPLFGTSYDYPNVVNGSFEQPVAYFNDSNDWYRANGTYIFPTGWTTSYTQGPLNNGNGNDRYGVGRPISRANFLGSDQDFFFNNGKIMDGQQAAFIQVGTSNTNDSRSSQRGLRQHVHGFQTGITYNWRTLVNARSITGFQVKFTFRFQAYGAGTGGWTNLIPLQTIKPVDPEYTYATPYKEYKGTFTVPATGPYTFEYWLPSQAYDCSLLVDCMQLTGPPIPAVKAWSMFE